MLSVNNLTCEIRGRAIFRNVSAEFSSGEIIGIAGKAGSGKTLLLDIIRNRHRDYDGSILYNGHNLKDSTRKDIRLHVSHFSASEEIINPEAALKDWILSGRIIHKKRLSTYTETDKDIALSEMKNFGLDEYADIRLKQVSETTQKMASLAKTFSAQSPVLLLESPDAGLNLNQKVLLTRCIKKYTLKGDKIVILASGDINFIASTCDRIIVLSSEGIAETGTQRIITGELIKKHFSIEAVVTKNIYSGLPEIQIIEEN